MKGIFKEQYFVSIEHEKSWEQSIRKASEPLLNYLIIEPSYVDDMIDNVNRFGPYIVILPNIAFAHAEPKGNVYKNRVAVLLIEEGVIFNSSHDPVKMVLVIAAKTKEDHIMLFSKLSKIFMDANKVEKLLKARSYKEFSVIIEKGK